jgi:hypothetical protein
MEAATRLQKIVNTLYSQGGYFGVFSTHKMILLADSGGSRKRPRSDFLGGVSQKRPTNPLYPGALKYF